jgi:hypothetical protein
MLIVFRLRSDARPFFFAVNPWMEIDGTVYGKH